MNRIFSLLFLLFALPLFGKGDIGKIYTNAEANNYLFPLDKEEKKHLLIEVPDHFKYAYYEAKPAQIILQFIPKSEKLKKWSEIITIWVFPPVDQFEKAIETVSDRIADKAGEKLQFLSDEDFKTVEYLYEIPDTRGKNQSKEAHHWKGYHGEEALYIIQYGFRFEAETLEKEHARLKKKASSFINRLRIVK